MTKKRKIYICIGSVVLSRDGDSHYVSPRRLPGLYKVSKRDCLFYKDEQTYLRDKTIFDIRSSKFGENFIILKPDSNGDYKIND